MRDKLEGNETKAKGKKRLNPHCGSLDTGLRREFGFSISGCMRIRRVSRFDFMREAFAGFLTDQDQVSIRAKRYRPLCASFDIDTYVSVAQARRLLKITHRAIFNLIKVGEIDFEQRDGAAIPPSPIDVENVKVKCERAISSRTLAR